MNQFNEVDFAFEADLDPTPAEPAIPLVPPPALSIKRDQASGLYDKDRAAAGLMRRVSVAISVTWWELVMRQHDRADEIDNAFLQAPPPRDFHMEYALDLLDCLGSHYAGGAWGILLALSGKEVSSAPGSEIDLGVMGSPLQVEKSLIIDLGDFLCLTADEGYGWWLDTTTRYMPEDYRSFGFAFSARIDPCIPGGIVRTMAEASWPFHVRGGKLVSARDQELDPEDPALWGYTRLGSAMGMLGAAPLEQVVKDAIQRKQRVQFDEDEMLRWLDQTQRGVAPTAAGMSPKQYETYLDLNPKVRKEIQTRGVRSQEKLLNEWTQKFKITGCA